MNEPWVVVIIAIATLVFGAPVMTALGTWIQSRFGLLNKKVETAADIAKEARAQEYADLMAFRQEQQKAMTSLRLEYRTLKEAHDDLERKHDALEREYYTLKQKVEHLNGELERVRTENTALKTRVAELERENYRLLAEVDMLRRSPT